MKEYLSNSASKILEKYEEPNVIEVINDIEICAIDKKDLEFLLGYTEESLKIESKLKEELINMEEHKDQESNSKFEYLNRWYKALEENKAMKQYIGNGIEFGYIDDREGAYKKFI